MTTIQNTPLTFGEPSGADGQRESCQTFQRANDAPVYVVQDAREFCLVVEATGEPTTGNQYVRTATARDMLHTLARTGYALL